LAVSDLRAALSAVSAAVPTRSPKPILANVLISEGTITATDLELRITAPLEGAGGPAILLPYKRLSSIVGSLVGTDEVTLRADGTACIVEGGNGTWRLPIEDANEYPPGDYANAKPIARLPADQFASLMGTVKFATDNESSRFALGAVLVEFRRPTDPETPYGTLSFIATDGRRLCAASCDIEQDSDDSDTLIPRDAIDTLVRLSKGAGSVQLETSGRELFATVDETIVKARLVEGKFPRWRDVDVDHGVTPSLVVAGALANACEMASICASEASKGTEFTISKEGLFLSARSAEYGESSATCDLVEVGHTCTVKLDPRFVLGWLRCGSIDAAETITLEAKDADSAVILRAGEGVRTVIMPLSRDA
jgi:DNA polymerase III subunit beta